MSAPPYSLLAAAYDDVMEHVDYPEWAGHVQRILRRHRPVAREIVELGCGTGALATALQPLGPPPDGYRYRAFDGSPEMVRAAREIAEAGGDRVTFGVLDFLDAVPGPPADAVLLLYDGLNYLLELDDVVALLRRACDALVPGGVFVVDQSTPANSVNHADGFDDAGETSAFRYVRTSAYDADARVHTTTFRLALPDGTEAVEVHRQRAYTLAEMRAAIAQTPFEEAAAYHDFTLDAAGEGTERVHWVLRRPADETAPAAGTGA